jgi:hypothetical protein
MPTWHNRKNFLFAGSDTGGDRAAAIYNLVNSAKLNGLDPEAYLRFVVERIDDCRLPNQRTRRPSILECRGPDREDPIVSPVLPDSY